MKANELRIGNLVTGYPINSINKIISIRENIIGNIPIKSRGEYLYPVEDASGIELTEEWLLKAGFKNIKLEKNQSFYRRQNDNLNLLIEEFLEKGQWRAKIGFCFLAKIEYVHQLQNLYFVLTNEELIFNL